MTEHTETAGTTREYPGPYRTYEAEDGTLVVYDRRNEDAYLRSDVTTDIRR